MSLLSHPWRPINFAFFGRDRCLNQAPEFRAYLGTRPLIGGQRLGSRALTQDRPSRHFALKNGR